LSIDPHHSSLSREKPIRFPFVTRLPNLLIGAETGNRDSIIWNWRFRYMNIRQPNSRNCFICGVENPLGLHIKFFDTAPGEVTAECTVPKEFQGYPGVVHGGIVAALLDEVAGRSQMGDVDKPRFMFTARLDVRYRKNVPTEQPLRLVGIAGARKERAAMAKGAIYSQEGTLLAEGEALLMNVPADVLSSVDLEALGWKVYADDR
jgi:acyl-coenzyme A thioesterase PaaI-like protein